MRLTIPAIDDGELEEIREVLASGYLTQGAKVAKFEGLVSKFVGSQFAFATSSCTTALHLALVALGIGPGDEVAVADFSFPATANVVVQTGAKPVLVDIELDTFTIDIHDLKAKLTPKTKAIIVVHTFGCSADMDQINQIAEQKEIAVIEDAACAIGTTYYGRFVGVLGTMGCFSFHPRKVITTAEGGMITTNDAELANRIQVLRNHGGMREKYWYTFNMAGFNYRLSDVHGAIGVAQMAKLPALIEKRRILAAKLRELLADIPNIQLPKEPAWGGHIYQSFVVLVNKNVDRDLVIENLRALDIESVLGTYALHAQPFYQDRYGYFPGEIKNSYLAYCQSLTLPLFPQMTEVDLETISRGLEKALAQV